MKIAILYSGRVLNYDTYYKNFQKYIVQDHDVDIFFFHNKNQNEDITGFIDLYKPKIVIDEDIEYDHDIIPANISGMYMFYSRYFIFKAFKQYVSDNNCNYDYVCSCRLDILPLHIVQFETLIHDDNTVNIPNLANSAGCNDLMAIGSIVAMEKYFNLVENYIELLIITNNTGSNEFILLTYLQKIGLNINRYPYRCLLRDSIWENEGGCTKIYNCSENLIVE